MEAGAGMAMQSHAAAAVGLRSAILGGREKRARAGSLRVGGPAGAGAKAMAMRTRGTKPVAPLWCVDSADESKHSLADEALLLKRKSEEVLFHLNGQCIYLVGMMGSGKSTVGKILAEVLGYSFFDSDKLVEQAVSMSSVAQIFKVHSEAFFRENGSCALRDLSSMRRLVVATGGAAVIRTINWNYMKKGLSVWLDVPLDALAKRIARVGTASRPLLDQPCDDRYTAAFSKLSMLAEQRGDAYHTAFICAEIAAKQGHGDVSMLTPTNIAIEALLKIGSFVTEDPTTNDLAGNLQADSQSRRIKAL
ncbi:shikimate kinase 2, chloroplastic-like [Miscanthus floridulus]|uniref:shikimate kinase 2, chloroplastic-like n=1 Tax=Miscanthus floridulus TaxID=154761 RepID=UPI00345AA0E4